jgi:hypothetical protein
MRLKNTFGKLVYKNVSKHIIDWEGKSRSLLQFKTKQFLKPYWCGQIVYEEFPVYGTKMKVDILNATKKIAIEVNGPQHNSFNKFFHQNSPERYLKSIKRDYSKRQWLELNDFTLIEIEEEEIELLSENFFFKKFNVTL